MVGDLVGGTTLLDVTDPTGDDNGPGTYQYPTSSNFQPGSFDITRFQVLQQGDAVYLRTTLRDLVETFGSPDGAQLLDVYVHEPGATHTSTAAAFASRNYSIAPADAWSQRLEVQGFAGPVWQDAGGAQVGTVSGVVASPAANTITIALPAAELGQPASGWSFSVVLTGQDGFSPTRRAASRRHRRSSRSASAPPATRRRSARSTPHGVPKAVDVITPDGVSQATELDPTQGRRS